VVVKAVQCQGLGWNIWRCRESLSVTYRVSWSTIWLRSGNCFTEDACGRACILEAGVVVSVFPILSKLWIDVLPWPTQHSGKIDWTSRADRMACLVVGYNSGRFSLWRKSTCVHTLPGVYFKNLGQQQVSTCYGRLVWVECCQM
jgi:hypothetical protein